MARARSTGNGRLESALESLTQENRALAQQMTALAHQHIALMQLQADFLTRAAQADKRLAELERINAERFARIEAILLEHHRMLDRLPEAVREKIGFKPAGS